VNLEAILGFIAQTVLGSKVFIMMMSALWVDLVISRF